MSWTNTITSKALCTFIELDQCKIQLSVFVCVYSLFAFIICSFPGFSSLTEDMSEASKDLDIIGKDGRR